MTDATRHRSIPAHAWWLALLAAGAAVIAAPARAADDYDSMLGYLAQSRIDDRALAGSTGAWIRSASSANGSRNCAGRPSWRKEYAMAASTAPCSSAGCSSSAASDVSCSSRRASASRWPKASCSIGNMRGPCTTPSRSWQSAPAMLSALAPATPGAGDAGWSATAPTSVAVASEGHYTLYPWAKDLAGHVSALDAAPPLATVFPDTELGAQLKMVARLIGVRAALGMQRQVFYVSIGDYDSHDAQIDNHASNLGDLAQALAAFQAAMDELTVANQVTTFTASDFGRSLAVNGDGTDHGWGGHHFVLGGAVRGRRFYGVFDGQGEYRVCVRVEPGDDAAALGLERQLAAGRIRIRAGRESRTTGGTARTDRRSASGNRRPRRPSRPRC